MGAVYVTWEEIKQVLPDVKDAQQTALLAMAERACRRFDRKAGVPEGFFDVAPAEATERVFYGRGEGYLVLDPFVNDDSFDVAAPEPTYLTPYRLQGHFLYANDAGTLGRGYWQSNVAYTITARWGFAETPADVKEAVLQMVVWMWDSRAKPYKGLVNGRFNPDTQYDAGMPRELRDSIADIRDWCIRQGWILP